MNAIELLKSQHKEVDGLFARLADAERVEKESLFLQIADALAIHTAIEERHFYPAIRVSRTESLVTESYEEHAEIKSVLAELLRLDTFDETFDAKIRLLVEEVKHHVGEEENDLFPKVEKLFDAAQLDEIGRQMEATAEELRDEGEPRQDVLDEAPTLQ